MLPVNLAVFEVADDALVALAFFQRLAAWRNRFRAVESPCKSGSSRRTAQRLAFAVRGEPDVRHAAAGDQFVQLKFAERPGAGRNRRHSIF